MLRSSGRVLAVTVAVLAVALAAASRLSPSPASELLVGGSSEIARASDTLERTFGQEPIVVSVEGDLQGGTLSAAGLSTLLGFEGDVARLDGVRSVYGPGTFINQTVIQAEEVLKAELGAIAEQVKRAGSEAERERILGDKAAEYRELVAQFGTFGLPSLDNAAFVQQLVFGAGVEPKERFRWLFPDRRHAVVLVRADPGLAGDRAVELGRRIEDLAAKLRIQGAQLTVGGLPLLAAGLERETRDELLRLAPVAVGAMLLLLLVALRRRRGRVLPLGLALGGTVLALGLSWPLGLGLTTATVAAMPVVLGLALDFAVQLQAAFWRRRAARPDESAEAAAVAARAEVGPTLGLAGGVMSAGFLILLVSPVPLLDRLGMFLALGTLSSLALTLLAGPALLARFDRSATGGLELPLPEAVRRARLPVGVVAMLSGIALGGLAFSGETRLESDLELLAPADLEQLQDVQRIQRQLGTTGTVSVMVRADDVTAPAVLGYVNDVARQVERREPTVRPGPNLAALVTGGADRAPRSREEVDGILRLLPRYFVDAVVSRDRKVSELTFAVPFVSVAEQGEIVRSVQAALGDPPDGVDSSVAGLVAAAASSTESLDGARPDLLLLAALLTALILFAAWRDITRVAIVLAPALLAAGLSALVLLVLDVRLSPLGAALEPLVLAVGLEFGMLLEMGFRQARAAGASPERAREQTLTGIGGAVALSASTVALGFGALAASRLPLLEQLGWLVAFELLLCLAVALLVVPAACQWAAERAPRPERGTPLVHG